MAITRIATGFATPGANGGVAPAVALDTSGANLLVISVSFYSGSTTALTVSDSKGNTWIPLTLRNAGTAAQRFYYATTPIVGSGHTVTVSATGVYPVITFSAYAGTYGGAPFEVENGATATSGSSLATGSVTPAANGALIVSGWAGMNNTSAPTVSAGLTKTTSQNPVSSIAVAGAVADTIQTTAAAINSTWSWTGSDHVAAAITVFREVWLPSAGVRVTQAAFEALTFPAPPVQVTQAVVEVLGSSVAVFTTAARVTQAAVEIVSLPPPPPLRVTQAALEVLYRTGGRWKLTIDGVDQTAAVDSFSYSFVLNERGRASLVLGDVLPEKLTEVVSYAKNGFTPLFGGVILSRSFAGRNQYDGTYQVTCECGDWFTYAEWVTISRIYDTEVTLKTVLQDVVTDALGAYGISVHPAQLDGPILAPFLWRYKKVADALRELSERTKYVVEITPAKRLRMFLPGTDAAPVTITEAAPHSQELRWSDSDRAGGAPVNKVTIICGPTGQREVHDERHYGDGVRRIWPLYAPFVAMIGALHIFSEHAGGYPVGIHGVDDMPYTIDLGDNSVYQRATEPVIASGDYLWLWYYAEFPFQVTASTGATPVIEHVEARTDILSIPAGQEVANSILDQFGGAAGSQDMELAITTDEDGFEVGQGLTVALPTTRSVSGAFVITELAMTIVLDTDQGDAYWTYQLKAAPAATVYQGSYLDDWRRIVASPSIITEVQAVDARTKNVPRKPKPTEPVYRPRYLEPGPAIQVVPALAAETRPTEPPDE